MDEETFNEQYARAVKAGKLAQQTEPRAVSAVYDAKSDRLTIELNNGAIFIVPCSLIQGLSNARPDKIAAVKVMPRGAALHWDELDVQMSVAGLMAGIFGTRAWMAEVERLRGQALSDSKVAAARENGRKGGRPRTRRMA